MTENKTKQSQFSCNGVVKITKYYINIALFTLFTSVAMSTKTPSVLFIYSRLRLLLLSGMETNELFRVRLLLTVPFDHSQISFCQNSCNWSHRRTYNITNIIFNSFLLIRLLYINTNFAEKQYCLHKYNCQENLLSSISHCV